MKVSRITLAVATALLSSAAMADSWDVTQAVSPSESTNITQEEAGSSVQSLNTINTDSGTSIAGNGADQTVTVATDETLTLDQEGGTATSVQSANYAAGFETIGTSSASPFVQTLTGGGSVNLNQMASGTSNVQAGNFVDTTGSAVNTSTHYISQVLSTATLTMAQGGLESSSGANDAVAISYGLQAGNAIISGGSSAGGEASQSASQATALAMGQYEATSSHQAVNYLGVIPQSN